MARQPENSERAQYFVLLLKGSVDEDEGEGDVAYRDMLSPATCRRVPVLTFESIAEGVRLVLDREFDGFIATSARAIWALKEHLDERELQSLSSRTWFVVGRGTAEAVKQAFGAASIVGQDCGNAERLIGLLGSMHSRPKQVCFICGNLRRGTIEEGLLDLGIASVTAVAYRTIPLLRSSLPDAPHGLKRVCAFFSPSGVSAALTAVRVDDKVLAIGETTARAVQEFGLTVSAVAPEPTPQGLTWALDALPQKQ